MDWEEKIRFYEKQQSSWAMVRELCEAGAMRAVDSERREHIQSALQLAANLEREASSMVHRARPRSGGESASH